jgi:probable phosphoglycerate mutase
MPVPRRPPWPGWSSTEWRDSLAAPVSDPSRHVVLVRHGETEWSRDGRHTGRTDVPLTETGRRQAQLLAAPLRRWSFAAVFSSPLARAVETCRLAGLECTGRRDDLREWDYGDVEGRTTPDMRRDHPGWSLWRDGVGGGETVEDVGRRADRVIAEVRAINGDVALVAHGHLLRILAARWLDLLPLEGRRFLLSAASLSVLGYEWETAAVQLWNDRSHLDSVPA